MRETLLLADTVIIKIGSKILLHENGSPNEEHIEHLVHQIATLHKQQKRKNKVGRRAAVPMSVEQRRINVSPISGVIDQNHARNGEATHHIER